MRLHLDAIGPSGTIDPEFHSAESGSGGGDECALCQIGARELLAEKGKEGVGMLA